LIDVEIRGAISDHEKEMALCHRITTKIPKVFGWNLHYGNFAPSPDANGSEISSRFQSHWRPL
jgi:hypothetical protein